MKKYNDIFVKSTDEAAIKSFLDGFGLSLGPEQGRAATEAYTDEYGEEHAAQEAIGDLSCFYASIKTTKEVSLTDGIETADEQTVVALVGIWATEGE